MSEVYRAQTVVNNLYDMNKLFYMVNLLGLSHCRENFGYVSGNWKDPPSSEPKYLRKRHMQLSMTLQCGKSTASALLWCSTATEVIQLSTHFLSDLR